MVYSKPEWTIPKPSSQAVESVVIVGLRMVYSKPARRESCDWRDRPCFTQGFWSKTIQMQQTFPGYLQVSLVHLCSSVPGKQGRPGEVDSKNKVETAQEIEFTITQKSDLCGSSLHPWLIYCYYLLAA